MTDTKNSIAVAEPTNRFRSVAEIKAQVRAINEIMKHVMKEDEHYGKIPGAGDKMILFKSGAEKIMATFNIGCNLSVEDLSTSDECRYRVKATAIDIRSGLVLGEGIGECSSNEEKYKWQSAVCDEEFEETPDDRRRLKWKRGNPPYALKQIRTDHADKANTVLKMSKKRAVVDMTLTVTGCSDIFAQDLDDGSSGQPMADEKPKESEAQKCSFDGCGQPVSGKVLEFSLSKYKKPLCMTCQKKAIPSNG